MWDGDLGTKFLVEMSSPPRPQTRRSLGPVDCLFVKDHPADKVPSAWGFSSYRHI